jgi:RepB DNA-primase from phage plasmid
MTFECQSDKNPFQFHIIFVGISPIQEGAHSWTKHNIKDIGHLHPDLDREAHKSLEAIRNSEVPAPNYVLDTSPGKHQGASKVCGFSQTEAGSLLHNLANKFGGDVAATASTRVLRLPGFANRKLREEFIAGARPESDARYRLRDFTIELDSPATPRRHGEGQTAARILSGEHRSQSERDWAYAKRARKA